MHLGTTGGLILSLVITGLRGYKAWKKGWPVGDTMQGCWTGYSFEKEDWDWKRPTATYALVGGKVVTTLAIKTNYNQETPTGWNL